MTRLTRNEIVMIPRTASPLALALVAALAGGCGSRHGSASGDAALKEAEQFRSKHEASYRKEYVPLAGLFFLNPGTNSVGSAAGNDVLLPARAPASIGVFVLDGSRVRFEPKPGANVMVQGQPITKAIELKSDDHVNSEGKRDGPDELTVGTIGFWVHPSGERNAIRLRDEEGEVARRFEGFHWFPIDPAYRVVGRFIKDPAPHEFHTVNQLGDDEVYKTEGVVEFTLNGETARMRPATTKPGRLYFIFRDGTSGKETYETARFLYSDLKDDGTTVMDFNEAYNPPCSFNPFTTCPLPIPENRLKVRILAGEKAYPHPPGHTSRPAP
jgi:uncharacterized protein (DUF1684 family)